MFRRTTASGDGRRKVKGGTRHGMTRIAKVPARLCHEIYIKKPNVNLALPAIAIVGAFGSIQLYSASDLTKYREILTGGRNARICMATADVSATAESREVFLTSGEDGGGDEATVRLVDLSDPSGATTRSFHLGRRAVFGIDVVSPRSGQLSSRTLLLAGNDSCKATVFDKRTGEAITALSAPPFYTRRIQCIPEWNNAVVLVGDDRYHRPPHGVRWYDLRTGHLDLLATGHTEAIYALDVDVKSGILCTGAFDNTMKIWDQKTRTKPVCSFVAPARISSLSFAGADKPNLVVCGVAGDRAQGIPTCAIFDLRKQDETLRTFYTHDAALVHDLHQVRNETFVSGTDAKGVLFRLNGKVIATTQAEPNHCQGCCVIGKSDIAYAEYVAERFRCLLERGIVQVKKDVLVRIDESVLLGFRSLVVI